MRTVLIVVAIVCFFLAALSAFTEVDWSEVGLVAAGLVAFAAAHLPLADRV